MANIQTVIDALQDAKTDETNCIRITDEARCAMVRILMKEAELLKEQQQKKAELLKRFDKEIEWAEKARVDSACEGENAWVEHYACQKSYYEHAKSIVENTL